ncbi:hypothetical protein QYE76_019424 [Lolium multiflorum]|uniref:F-box domain-containing protein n=1 Tax=Lolium multiflorum TaxID=4521 RepID=A0AAD8VN45_LOLMU|nr:hypothetical protein QYE76_019424 [Lolium multiflorum]
MSRRRSSPAPLDDDDLLGEILLRLPPQPSSLPRASLVCARWRSVLSDPQFLGRFRKRHGKPPLLGFFTGDVGRRHVFTPVLGSPDRIPAARFSVPWSRKGYDCWDFRGCRHGLAVLVNDRGRGVVVWDPLTGQHRHHRVPFSPNPRYGIICQSRRRLPNAAAFCSDCRCTSTLPPRLHPISSLAPAPRRSRRQQHRVASDCYVAPRCRFQEPRSGVGPRILASSSLASVRREENASPARMSRRRSSPAPLDDDDLLQEILLRLPPQPSSLPRASLVCARWRSVLSDPQFLGRFRKRHRKPPLLGFFTGDVGRRHVFTPVLGSPDRIPAARFSVPWSRKGYDCWDLRGCHHGLAVLVNDRGRGVVVWDPLTGQHRHHRVPFSPNPRYGRGVWQSSWRWHPAVMCTNAEHGHVRGALYVHERDFAMRINLSDHTYQVISLPDDGDFEEFWTDWYLGKSSGGVYCAILFKGHSGFGLQVWFLDETCAQMKWALRRDVDLRSLLPNFSSEHGQRRRLPNAAAFRSDCRCTSTLPPRLHPISLVAPAPRRSRRQQHRVAADVTSLREAVSRSRGVGLVRGSWLRAA